MKVYFRGSCEVPDGTPPEDIEAWLKFEIGDVASMSRDNALAHTDLKSANPRVEVD